MSYEEKSQVFRDDAYDGIMEEFRLPYRLWGDECKAIAANWQTFYAGELFISAVRGATKDELKREIESAIDELIWEQIEK